MSEYQYIQPKRIVVMFQPGDFMASSVRTDLEENPRQMNSWIALLEAKGWRIVYDGKPNQPSRQSDVTTQYELGYKAGVDDTLDRCGGLHGDKQ